MKNRYNMTAGDGTYIESDTYQELVEYRKTSETFKGRHIKVGLQAWDDVVLPLIAYPPTLQTRRDFELYNMNL